MSRRVPSAAVTSCWRLDSSSTRNDWGELRPHPLEVVVDLPAGLSPAADLERAEVAHPARVSWRRASSIRNARSSVGLVVGAPEELAGPGCDPSPVERDLPPADAQLDIVGGDAAGCAAPAPATAACACHP